MADCLDIGIVDLEGTVVRAYLLGILREEECVVVDPFALDVDMHECGWKDGTFSALCTDSLTASHCRLHSPTRIPFGAVKMSVAFRLNHLV